MNLPQQGTNTQTQAQVQSHGHPTVKTFLIVGAILFVVTAIEWGIVYLDMNKSLMKTILYVLSFGKFVLVAGVFMHLKFDKKYLTIAFAIGFVLATLMVIALKLVNVYGGGIQG